MSHSLLARGGQLVTIESTPGCSNEHNNDLLTQVVPDYYENPILLRFPC